MSKYEHEELIGKMRNDHYGMMKNGKFVKEAVADKKERLLVKKKYDDDRNLIFDKKILDSFDRLRAAGKIV